MDEYWLNYFVSGDAASKKYTIAVTQASATIGLTICNNEYADFVIGEDAVGWKCVLMPKLDETIPRSVFNVPDQIRVNAAGYAEPDGSTRYQAVIQRSQLAVSGYPGTWSYVFGYTFTTGGNDQTMLKGLLAGTLVVEGQSQPGLICSVL